MYLRCTGKTIFKEICITKHAWELKAPFRQPPAAKEKLLFFSSFPLFRVNNFMREKKLPYHICPCQKKGTACCKYFVSCFLCFFFHWQIFLFSSKRHE